jgi:hypothetical protein
MPSHALTSILLLAVTSNGGPGPSAPSGENIRLLAQDSAESYIWAVRLLRWMFWMSALAVLIWFGATVPLGNRTFFGHLRAISATPEAHDLATGTGEEARRVAERIRQEWSREPGTATSQRPDRDDRSVPRDSRRERPERPTGRPQSAEGR